jgi:hypothetical protein
MGIGIDNTRQVRVFQGGLGYIDDRFGLASSFIFPTSQNAWPKLAEMSPTSLVGGERPGGYEGEWGGT